MKKKLLLVARVVFFGLLAIMAIRADLQAENHFAELTFDRGTSSTIPPDK